MLVCVVVVIVVVVFIATMVALRGGGCPEQGTRFCIRLCSYKLYNMVEAQMTAMNCSLVLFKPQLPD